MVKHGNFFYHISPYFLQYGKNMEKYGEIW